MGRGGFQIIPNNINQSFPFLRRLWVGVRWGGLRTSTRLAVSPLPGGWTRSRGHSLLFLFPLCSQPHQEGRPVPGHTAGLQGSSWVASPGQNMSLELGHSRERCRQPGSPPGTRQLWEQEDQDVQGVQPGVSERKACCIETGQPEDWGSGSGPKKL